MIRGSPKDCGDSAVTVRVQGSLEPYLELEGIERFDQIVFGSPAHRFDGVFDLAMGADHDEGDVGTGGPAPTEQLKAVEARHSQIADDSREGFLLKKPLRGQAVLHASCFET